jgi:hypothetical protein
VLPNQSDDDDEVCEAEECDLTPMTDSITCPICGMTSYHPTDVAEGYCGRCHDWWIT